MAIYGKHYPGVLYLEHIAPLETGMIQNASKSEALLCNTAATEQAILCRVKPVPESEQAGIILYLQVVRAWDFLPPLSYHL
jgi:hypothetical protein